MSTPLVEQSGTFRPMMRLAAPVVLEQFLALAVGLSDRVLTGHFLDTPHIAAVTAMAYVLWMLHGLFSLVAIGSTALIARFVGGKKLSSARLATNQSLMLGAILAILITVVALLFSDRFVQFLALEGERGALSVEYIRCLAPSIPMLMLVVTGIGCWRGAGDMVVGLGIMAVVNAVNIGISWALVLGVGPFPELGWRGVAIGTASGYAVGGLLTLAMLLAGRSRLRLRLRLLRPRWDVMKRLLWIGLPGGADMLSLIGCQMWFISLISRLGELSLAAHGVALAVESLAFVPGAAFAMAATTLTGQYLGAGNPRKAARSVWMALAVGGGFMAMMGVLFFFFSEQLPSLLVSADRADVAAHAAPLLRIISVAMPAVAAMMIVNGGLRGAGDVRWPLAYSLVGLLGVRIPGTYWLAFATVAVTGTNMQLHGWDLGVVGAWMAMSADVMIRATLLTSRFLGGRWKRIAV